jgi:hypothetical protein
VEHIDHAAVQALTLFQGVKLGKLASEIGEKLVEIHYLTFSITVASP